MDVISYLADTFGLGTDPRINYSLAAALLVALVSLSNGLFRLDFLPLFRPAVLLRVCGAVALAFGAVALSHALPATQYQAAPYLFATSLLPLLLIALAYGPSAGLVAGVLFSAAAAGGAYPSWSEALLVLELMVLGWLAMSPSPRKVRWAGTFNAALAHLLAAGTAGVAFLTWRDGDVTVSSLLAEQVAALPALLLPWVLLLLFGPQFYRRFMPYSRIAQPAARVQNDEPATTVQLKSTLTMPPRARTGVTTLEIPALDKDGGRRRSNLAEPALSHEDPNG